MKRRVFNFLSWMSLLLCVVTAVLWLSAQNHPTCYVTLNWSEGNHHLTYTMAVRGWDAEELYDFTSGETYIFDHAISEDIKQRQAQDAPNVVWSKAGSNGSFNSSV